MDTQAAAFMWRWDKSWDRKANDASSWRAGYPSESVHDEGSLDLLAA